MYHHARPSSSPSCPRRYTLPDAENFMLRVLPREYNDTFYARDSRHRDAAANVVQRRRIRRFSTLFASPALDPRARIPPELRPDWVPWPSFSTSAPPSIPGDGSSEGALETSAIEREAEPSTSRSRRWQHQAQVPDPAPAGNTSETPSTQASSPYNCTRGSFNPSISYPDLHDRLRREVGVESERTSTPTVPRTNPGQAAVQTVSSDSNDDTDPEDWAAIELAAARRQTSPHPHPEASPTHHVTRPTLGQTGSRGRSRQIGRDTNQSEPQPRAQLPATSSSSNDPAVPQQIAARGRPNARGGPAARGTPRVNYNTRATYGLTYMRNGIRHFAEMTPALEASHRQAVPRRMSAPSEALPDIETLRPLDDRPSTPPPANHMLFGGHATTNVSAPSEQATHPQHVVDHQGDTSMLRPDEPGRRYLPGIDVPPEINPPGSDEPQLRQLAERMNVDHEDNETQRAREDPNYLRSLVDEGGPGPPTLARLQSRNRRVSDLSGTTLGSTEMSWERPSSSDEAVAGPSTLTRPPRRPGTDLSGTTLVASLTNSRRPSVDDGTALGLDEQHVDVDTDDDLVLPEVEQEPLQSLTLPQNLDGALAPPPSRASENSTPGLMMASAQGQRINGHPVAPRSPQINGRLSPSPTRPLPPLALARTEYTTPMSPPRSQRMNGHPATHQPLTNGTTRVNGIPPLSPPLPGEIILPCLHGPRPEARPGSTDTDYVEQEAHRGGVIGPFDTQTSPDLEPARQQTRRLHREILGVRNHEINGELPATHGEPEHQQRPAMPRQDSGFRRPRWPIPVDFTDSFRSTTQRSSSQPTASRQGLANGHRTPPAQGSPPRSRSQSHGRSAPDERPVSDLHRQNEARLEEVALEMLRQYAEMNSLQAMRAVPSIERMWES